MSNKNHKRLFRNNFVARHDVLDGLQTGSPVSSGSDSIVLNSASHIVFNGRSHRLNTTGPCTLDSGPVILPVSGDVGRNQGEVALGTVCGGPPLNVSNLADNVSLVVAGSVLRHNADVVLEVRIIARNITVIHLIVRCSISRDLASVCLSDSSSVGVDVYGVDLVDRNVSGNDGVILLILCHARVIHVHFVLLGTVEDVAANLRCLS